MYNIEWRPDHYYPGVTFTIATATGAFDLTGATITMWVVNAVGDAAPLVELSTANGKISIVNAAAGIFCIMPITFSLPRGKYPYDIKIVKGGHTYRYVEGYLILQPEKITA
jgi:hypothetical protein